ncbi:MAG TPA: di-trans,poly-cis-decaprenylcistransferase [Candidatus Acidoferrum sp.]|nr:di-trans,poly-cis-decaprenylcistransferase [Candidatus Acidoferrum sp.]
MNSPRGLSLHVAIITDGNGRWATSRGMPRSAGHRAGAENLRRVARAAPALGIRTLTLYAFSANNWQRPQMEVAALLRLLQEYLTAETKRCAEDGIRMTVIGRRDRLSPGLQNAIAAAEEATAAGCELHIRLAVDYSSREALFRAARRFYKVTRISRDSFEEILGEATHDAVREVDLVIRTGGEQRLSDFLLWESAYAELYFTRKMWPEFSAEDLREAIREFHSRVRTFGRLPDALAS